MKNTKKHLKNKKNNSKRTKRTKKQTKKNIKKGGEYISEGTYGKVYANPRLLCEDETLMTPGIENEVSKIFESDYDANSEFNNINELNIFLRNRGILEELEKYAIIPKKICNINRDSLGPPYNTNEWMQNKSRRYNSTIFNPNINTILPTTTKILNNYNEEIDIPAYNKLIISDKGGNDLSEIIRNITSYDNLKVFLQKLFSIGKGIQLLQNNGLIHGDIKDVNCIEHNGTFKLIDLSDIREISTTEDPAAMPHSFGYHIWPITAFYTYLFKKRTVFNNITDINTIITEQRIKINFNAGNEDDEFNTTGLVYSKFLFERAFDTTGKGYTPEQNGIINEIQNNLIDQKPSYRDLGQFVAGFNNIFTTEFTDINEFKMDLFKRIDIYSFGIIILQCIKKYLAVETTMNKNKREKMVELYIIVNKCCYQSNRVADINEIVVLYEDIVNTMPDN